MKKISILLFGLLAASQVLAGNVCTNGAAPTGGAYATTTGMYVIRAFPIRCSANVEAGSAETAVAFGVGALSLKGRSYFQGNTGGGAISGTSCGVTCTAGQETTGLQAAVNAAT